jgi:Mrp family chromosome partitioning ATPase
MDNLIEEMKEEYDRIIFDVPPVFGATDALMLGSNMDGTLVVIKSGHIDKRAIKRFRDLYSTTQTRILGGVLNKVDPKDGRFGHSFYYYYSEAYGSVKKHVSNR